MEKNCNKKKNQNLHVVYNFHIQIMCGKDIPQMFRMIICLLYVFYLVCKKQTYGVACSQACGSCSNGEACHPANGTCVNGCMEGLMGSNCKIGELK